MSNNDHNNNKNENSIHNKYNDSNNLTSSIPLDNVFFPPRLKEFKVFKYFFSLNLVICSILRYQFMKDLSVAC